MSAKVVNSPAIGAPPAFPVTPEGAERLERLGHRQEFASGKILFREHDPADGFYVLREGRVELRITGHLGAAFRLRTCAPGDVIGLSAAVSGRGRESTALAITPVATLFVPANLLLAAMRQSPELSLYIGGLLAGEVRSTQQVSLRLRHVGNKPR
jgi:CRP-like cAMP-binding protein